MLIYFDKSHSARLWQQRLATMSSGCTRGMMRVRLQMRMAHSRDALCGVPEVVQRLLPLAAHSSGLRGVALDC